MHHENQNVIDDAKNAETYGVSGLEPTKLRNAGLSWEQCMFMILAYVVGVGVLSLPCAVAKLGWLPSLAAFLLTAAGWSLSSSLYMRLFAAVPEAKCLGDVARAAFGFSGEAVVALLQYSFMLSISALFHLTASLMLSQATGADRLTVTACWVVSVVMLLLLQADLSQVGTISILGTATIIIVCVMLLASFAIGGRLEGAYTELIAGANVVSIGVSVSDLVTAFSGQHLWIELQSECAEPSKFPRAVKGATACVCVTYATVAFAGYYFVGARALGNGDPISSFIQNPIVRSLTLVFTLLHCLCTYAINGSFFVRNVTDKAANAFGTGALRLSDSTRWFLVSAALVGISAILTMKVSFFDDLAGLNGALFLYFLTYTVPLLLALRLLDLGRVEAYTYVILVVVTVVAATASVEVVDTGSSLNLSATIEVLMLGILMGVVPTTMLGLFVSAWLQFKKGPTLGI